MAPDGQALKQVAWLLHVHEYANTHIIQGLQCEILKMKYEKCEMLNNVTHTRPGLRMVKV